MSRIINTHNQVIPSESLEFRLNSYIGFKTKNKPAGFRLVVPSGPADFPLSSVIGFLYSGHPADFWQDALGKPPQGQADLAGISNFRLYFRFEKSVGLDGFFFSWLTFLKGEIK